MDRITKQIGLTYSAAFVPQKLSRNAGDKNLSINWKVSFSKDGSPSSITTDYMQGIGHMPPSKARLYPNDKRANEWMAANQGKYQAGPFITKQLPAPSADDVLECLIIDASVLDYACFEDWAADFGYEEDSIKAEKTYRQCLETALTLRKMINISKARELFEQRDNASTAAA